MKRGDIAGLSLASNYYAPELWTYLRRLAENPAATKPLSGYIIINPPIELTGLDDDALVGFIPMLGVADSATGEYVVTNRPLREVRKGYTPFADGDILWAKITPSMQNGKTCLVQGLSNGIGFGSTEFHVIRVLDEGVSPKFVLNFLGQDTIRKIATYSFTGSAGQQRVPSSFLQDLPFPAISMARQLELVATMDTARQERKAKLEESDALLSGTDDFILDALGIRLPQPEARQIFAVNHQSARQRFDAHFHLPEFAQFQGALLQANHEHLGDIAVFSTETWRHQDHGEDTFRYIEIGSVDSKTGEAGWNYVPTDEAPSRAKMRIRSDDLIVSLTRPHHGSIALLDAGFDGCVASTGFAVIREVAPHVDRQYLWCVLRAQICLMQMLRRSSGGNYPAITEAELRKVVVPVPKMEVQSQIATGISLRLTEARRLRVEADEVWMSAKTWFEGQLVGTETP